MNRFYMRVCMLAVGIALAAGPVAFAGKRVEERPGPSGDAQHGPARLGPGSGEKHHQGPYRAHHGKWGKQGKRAHGMAAGRHRLPKMMRRTLRFIVHSFSPEQREQARKIRLNLRRQMNTLRAQLKNFRLDMREILRKFPVDQAAVKAIFDQMAKLRWKLLSFRLSALAETQKMAGKKLWDEARKHAWGGPMPKPGSHRGPGPRPGHPGS